MDKTASFVTFILGAAIGSAATWYFTKKYYETIAQKEIDSVKEVFSKREVSNEPIRDVESDRRTLRVSHFEEKSKDVDDIMAYSKKLNDLGYTDYSGIKPSKNKDSSDISSIEVIPPEEFGEVYGFDTISMTLYSDKVLTDDFDEPVKDIEGTVGAESLTHFGEYEDDSVFVRNHRLKCDFEILLDVRKYSDILKTKPYKAEELYEE